MIANDRSSIPWAQVFFTDDRKLEMHGREMMKKQARLGRREKIENSLVQRNSTYNSAIGDGVNWWSQIVSAMGVVGMEKDIKSLARSNEDEVNIERNSICRIQLHHCKGMVCNSHVECKVHAGVHQTKKVHASWGDIDSVCISCWRIVQETGLSIDRQCIRGVVASSSCQCICNHLFHIRIPPFSCKPIVKLQHPSKKKTSTMSKSISNAQDSFFSIHKQALWLCNFVPSKAQWQLRDDDDPSQYFKHRFDWIKSCWCQGLRDWKKTRITKDDSELLAWCRERVEDILSRLHNDSSMDGSTVPWGMCMVPQYTCLIEKLKPAHPSSLSSSLELLGFVYVQQILHAMDCFR